MLEYPFTVQLYICIIIIVCLFVVCLLFVCCLFVACLLFVFTTCILAPTTCDIHIILTKLDHFLFYLELHWTVKTAKQKQVIKKWCVGRFQEEGV